MAGSMFKIYLYNWANNYNAGTGKYTLVSNETEALSIPVDSPDKIWLLAPMVKAEVNKAESFDFTLDPGSEYYNAFIALKTWIRVVYDGTTIFWGHVKTINNSNIIQKRSVHAEGVYTTLADTPIEGLEEDFQSDTTAYQYFTQVINSHNAYCEDSFKQFTPGNISVTMSGEWKKRGATGWSTSLSELEKLIEETGGYVRARYNDGWASNGAKRNYLDWSKLYFRDLGDGKRPTIKLAKNLVDISKGVESNEIFTRVIPIGHKAISTTTSSSTKESSFVYLDGSKYIKVKDVPGVNDGFRSSADFLEAEDRYGVIYKTVNFQNASTASQLREYCIDWIQNNYFGIVNNFSIKAVDMHMLGEADPQILVGDLVDVTYPEFDNDGTAHMITRKLICKAVQYNLLQPQNNVYTFGVPCDAVDFEYGTKAKKKSAAKSAASAAAEQEKTSSGGGGSKIEVTWSTVLGWLRYYYYSCMAAYIVPWTETRWARYKHTKDESGRLVQEDQPYQQQRDSLPYDSFKNNGEFRIAYKVDAGDDGHGNKLYTTEYTYIYAHFHRPDGTGSVKGRILGHYQISSGIAKESYEHRQEGNTFTLHQNGFDYGVCVTTDGHIYTFAWNVFYPAFYERQKWNDLEGLEKLNFSTFFEIAKTNKEGSLKFNDALESSKSDVSSLPTQETETTWKTYPYEEQATDENGNLLFNEDGSPMMVTKYKTTAMIGTDEGWSAFGFITGDDGQLIPTVKLNDKVTYTDADGNVVTKSGFVTAQDLNLPEIPSFTTKIANIDYLITQRAVVGELRAAVAALGGEYGEESFVKDKDGNFVKKENGDYILKEGTTFFTNSQNILGASGTYYVKETKDPKTGEIQRDLVVKDGSSLKVDKNGVLLGVYDEQNLTGGIIVEKINGETQTRINGTQINIGDSNTKRTLAVASEEYEQLVSSDFTGWQTVTEQVTDSDGKTRNVTRRILKGLSAGAQVWDGGKQASFGIYHDGNLDGGIIVSKINKETTTKITGSHIKIGTSGTKDISLTDAITINDSGFLQSKSSMLIQGNLLVTKNNGSGGMIRASDLSVGLGGTLTFEDPTGAGGSGHLILHKSDVAALMNKTQRRVKITGPDTNDKYTLWYLPASAISSADSEWLKCESFSSTPILSGSWDGGSGTSPAYFYVKSARSGKVFYKVNIGGNAQDWNAYLDINNTLSGLGTDLTYYEASKKQIRATVALVAGGMSGPNSVTYHLIRYRKILNFDATPAWNAGWDDACKKVIPPRPNTSSSKVVFAYPTSTKVGSAVVRADTNLELSMYSDSSNNDYVCLGTLNAAGQASKDYAKFRHGKYTEGRNYEKSIIYTRFGYVGTAGYYVYAYEDPSAEHDTSLASGRLIYKLGQNDAGNYVQIQDSDGNRIANTPQFTVGITGFSLDNDGKEYSSSYMPNARYIIASTNTGVTKNLYLRLNSGSWDSNDKRTIVLNMNSYSGPKVIGVTVDASSIRTAGKNSVTLNNPTWSSGSSSSSSRTLTVSASNGASKSKWLGMKIESWTSSNQATVKVYQDNYTTGSVVMSVTVDASSCWRNGYILGQADGEDGVYITGFAQSGSKVVVALSNGSSGTFSINTSSGNQEQHTKFIGLSGKATSVGGGVYHYVYETYADSPSKYPLSGTFWY